MSPTHTAPEAIEALALELQGVEWFGRSSLRSSPARTSVRDLLLALGTLAGSMLQRVGRG